MPGMQRNDALNSVFPRKDFTTPTPQATPNIGTIASPGQSFGGFGQPETGVDRSISFIRAWSEVTRYLAVTPALAIDSGRQFCLSSDNDRTAHGKELIEAFYVVFDLAPKDLSSWYQDKIREHFRKSVLPQLQAWQQHIPPADSLAVLHSTLTILKSAQGLYLGPLQYFAENVISAKSFTGTAKAFLAATKSYIHALVLHSFPRHRLKAVLRVVVFDQLLNSLEQNSDPEKCMKEGKCCCTVNLDGLPFELLRDVGLGADVTAEPFAQAVDYFLMHPAINRRCFQVDWSTQTTVVPNLHQWAIDQLHPPISRALLAIGESRQDDVMNEDGLSFLALMHLGRLRAVLLFDYVKTWPASKGAIMDIRECLNVAPVAYKLDLCNNFVDEIQERLLHAGASTVEILGIYVNVIHVFQALDSRGVLLEKVAIPVRKYLRARDDFVPIIASSFLADVDEDGKAVDDEKVCADITAEVANSTLEATHDKNGKVLDWDDMEWEPDPIDAGPDFKSSKSSKADDVIAYILNLFSQDEFIKESSVVLAQHLLDTADSDYEKEIRLVELFKSRLEMSNLQTIEVMLRDMQYSVKIGKRINPLANYESTTAAPTPKEIQAAIPDEGITLTSLYSQFESRIKQAQFLAALKLVANKRHDLYFAKRTRIPAETKKKDDTNFKAQILSGQFWPQLRSNEYKMPASLESLNQNFEQRFQAFASQQKLLFRPALSKVSVHLEMEDRTVDEVDVLGWRASVLDMFASKSGLKGRLEATQYDDSVGLTAEQIVEALSMEDELVHDALSFWTNKQVLYRRSDGVSAVLERLDTLDSLAESENALSDAPDDQAQISAVVSQDAMLRENAPMFSQFIVNMLQNQGPKAVGGPMGIASLLKMVLPTFTYGEKEVQWLLGEMAGKGEVVKEGEAWRVKS